MKMGCPHTKYYSAKFGGHRYCRTAGMSFYICHHIIKKSHDFEGGFFKGKVTISGKFGGNRYAGRADIVLLSFSRDHIIKTSHDFEGGFFQLRVTILASLVTIGILEEQIYVF